MPDFIRDILIVAVAIIALVIAWEVFKLLFVIILIAIIIVCAYRLLLWLYALIFDRKNRLE
ncbi:hypothetical protein OAO18_01960 [Francisellaceae bacterium]|jgi:Flp pilus assembly protein TadB|nr:hypothetical protein [Francisellaceae bacterium]